MTKRDGIEGYVDNLRQLLNKLTHQNFDGMVEQITEIMDKVLRQVMGKGTKATPEQLTELKTVGATIFTIASSNSFYAEVYARLVCACLLALPEGALILIADHVDRGVRRHTLVRCGAFGRRGRRRRSSRR